MSTLAKLTGRLPTGLQKVLYDAWFRYSLRRWKDRKPSKQGPGRSIVIINHHYGLDIKAFLAGDHSATIRVFEPFNILKNIRYYFGKEDAGFDERLRSGEMSVALNAYQQAVVRPLVSAFKAVGAEVILTPSDVFYWLRPILTEAKKEGILIVVQDKEGTLPRGSFIEDHAKWIKFFYPPIADKIYCWNRNSKRLWIEAGAAESVIKVLGQPRSDFFFHEARWPAPKRYGLAPGRKRVLFFTFEEDAYVERQVVGSQARPWKTMRDEIHGAVIEMARANPAVDWIIKPHPQQRDAAAVSDYFLKQGLENIHLFGGAGVSSELIVLSDIVVGFQTTALIEAMFLARPIIYTAWGPEYQFYKNNLVPIEESGGCLAPSDVNEFKKMLGDALTVTNYFDEEKTLNRRNFIKDYFDMADGSVCVRIIEDISAILR